MKARRQVGARHIARMRGAFKGRQRSGGQGRLGAHVAAGGPTSQPGAIRRYTGAPGRERVPDSGVSQDECFTCVACGAAFGDGGPR